MNLPGKLAYTQLTRQVSWAKRGVQAKMSKKQDILREVMTELARKGGKAAAKKLTKQQRIERARKAGTASGRARRKRAKS